MLAWLFDFFKGKKLYTTNCPAFQTDFSYDLFFKSTKCLYIETKFSMVTSAIPSASVGLFKELISIPNGLQDYFDTD
jgi:hypothetical protein